MKKLFILIMILIVVFAGWRIWHSEHRKTSSNPISSSMSSNTSASGFDKSKYSISDASSLWAVVNKQRPLNPKNYAPGLTVPNVPMRGSITYDEKHVSPAMVPALAKMFAAAKAQGINLNLQSGYRSYQTQVGLYAKYVKSNGQAEADTFSARPGYSEHQTGLAADVGTTDGQCEVARCFGSTPEGKWIAANSYKYGFIVRYPNSENKITGYEYEPWHLRYVGIKLATEMHKEGITTLEQFFGLPAAPGY